MHRSALVPVLLIAGPLLLLTPARGHAQGPPLSGEWQITTTPLFSTAVPTRTYPATVRVEDCGKALSMLAQGRRIDLQWRESAYVGTAQAIGDEGTPMSVRLSVTPSSPRYMEGLWTGTARGKSFPFGVRMSIGGSDEPEDVFDEDVDTDDLCVIGGRCLNPENLEEAFSDPGWTADKEEYGRLYETATGETIPEDAWEAAEREASRGRTSDSHCSATADACTRNTEDGIRIFYNSGKIRTDAQAEEHAGHEAKHAAGAVAHGDARTGSQDAANYYTAVDHMLMCKQGDPEACQQYDEERSRLPPDDQDRLDEAEERVDEAIEEGDVICRWPPR